MLDLGELAAAQRDAEELLPSQCVIRTHSRAPDGGGGFTDGYTPQAAVPCRLSPVGGGEGATRGGRIDDRTTHVLTLAVDAVITAADQVEVEGQRYEVTLVRSRPDLEIVRRVEVRQAG